MRRIRQIIWMEILPPGLIALFLLTFVIFTREFGRLAQLLIGKEAGTQTVFWVVVSLLPGILIFTFPISFLVGTLIGFSRLSTESEIVALRAAGVSVRQILRPVLLLALPVFVGTAFLTLYLNPAAARQLRELRQQIGLRPVRTEIKPRVFNEDFPGMILYVEDVELHNRSWRGVLLAETENGQARRIILARRGHLLFSPDGRRLQLHFEEGSIYEVEAETPAKYGLSSFEQLDVPVRLTSFELPNQQPWKVEERPTLELWRESRRGEAQRAALVELHRRLALPPAAFLFAVLGVTLGIRTHRGGRGYGFVTSMTLAFFYYLLFITGSKMAANALLPVFWGVWGTDLVLLLLALWTLAKAERESRLLDRLLNHPRIHAALQFLTRRLHRAGIRRRGEVSRLLEWLWDFPLLRLRLAQILDLYLMRLFAWYFLPVILVFLGLTYLFTFFELVDEVFHNQIPYSVVVDYFTYWTPQLVLLLSPLSILIATLVTFGLLERTQQLTALKSCGVSLYRASLPVLILTALLASLLYVTQEYVLPYSNQRQENLRNYIKGKPAQTFQPGRRWIFGREHRLYHYRHFHAEHNMFAQFSIFELDLKNVRLLRHVFAERAYWDPYGQVWRLSSGWQRNFQEGRGAFHSFQQESLQLGEKPDYFREEVKESSKMSYRELARYIADLEQGGFEVDHLKTELHRKIAFPILNLLMLFLGIPFALTIGRKGALYGAALGVLIGMIYWALFQAFGILGDNGLLSPLLAAWGPNLLFGSGACFLFLTVRT